MLRGTIRFRITALATLLVAAALIVSGVVIVTAQSRQLVANLDQSLEQRADELAALVVAGPIEVIPNTNEEDRAAQLVTTEGAVLIATANVEGLAPIVAPPTGDEAFRTIEGLPIDDDEFRVYSRTVQTDEGIAILHVAENSDDIADNVRILRTTLLLLIPVVVAALAGLVWWLVGRTLQPVEAIRTEVAGIGGSELDRRVPVPDTDDEVSRLAQTMNEMLERVEDATVRQQRFVADASHELRSPLTRIRTELEVDLARPETADLRTTGESVLEETVAMEALIGDLLHLARSDAGASAGRRQPVDLDDLVMREAASIRARGRVTVDMHGVSAAQVVGDPDHLARAVRNLVDNAQRHATSAITLALVEHGGVARLVVADDGPGIPTGQRGLIFERFARLDDARSRDAGGTGLGLAITREIIEAHGGTIVVGDADAGGAEFVVEIPLSRP